MKTTLKLVAVAAVILLAVMAGVYCFPAGRLN